MYLHQIKLKIYKIQTLQEYNAGQIIYTIIISLTASNLTH